MPIFLVWIGWLEYRFQKMILQGGSLVELFLKNLNYLTALYVKKNQAIRLNVNMKTVLKASMCNVRKSIYWYKVISHGNSQMMMTIRFTAKNISNIIIILSKGPPSQNLNLVKVLLKVKKNQLWKREKSNQLKRA